MNTPLKLTHRELEVLALAFEDVAPKNIAARMNISVRTVNFHIYNAYLKLGVHSRLGAYRRTVELGIQPVYPYPTPEKPKISLTTNRLRRSA